MQCILGVIPRLPDYERSLVIEEEEANGGYNIYRRNKSMPLATHSPKPSVEDTFTFAERWPYNNAKYA